MRKGPAAEALRFGGCFYRCVRSGNYTCEFILFCEPDIQGVRK